MRVGFTGTRNGLTTEPQRQQLRDILTKLQPTVFVHGMCRGADEDAALMVREMFPRAEIVAYPGIYRDDPDNKEDQSSEARRVSDRVEPELAHAKRNKLIVTTTDCLVAVPPCYPLPPRGGTRMTITMAKKAKKPIHYAWVDGKEHNDV